MIELDIDRIFPKEYSGNVQISEEDLDNIEWKD